MNFWATLGLKSAGFQKGLNQAIRSLEGFRRSFLQVAGALGASLGIGSIVSNIKETATQLSVAKATMENVSSSMYEYRDNLEFVKRLSEEYKQDLITLTDGFAKFHAAAQGTNITLSEQRFIYEGLTKAAAYFHMSADRTQNMMVAVEQMMSKGKITAEELRRQLGNNLPGAYAKMAQAAMEFGKTQEGVNYKNIKSFADFESAMKKGQVGLDVLVKFVEKLNEETSNINLDSLQLAANEMKNAWTNLINSTGVENGIKKIYEITANFFNFLNRNLVLVRNMVNVLAVSAIPRIAQSIIKIAKAAKGLQWGTWIGIAITLVGTLIAYFDNLDARINRVNRKLKEIAKIEDPLERLAALNEEQRKTWARIQEFNKDPGFRERYQQWKDSKDQKVDYKGWGWGNQPLFGKHGIITSKENNQFKEYEGLVQGMQDLGKEIDKLRETIKDPELIGPVLGRDEPGLPDLPNINTNLIGGSGSGSGSKAKADKTVKDYVEDYKEELHKLNNQFNANAITDEEYRESLFKLGKTAWENITAFDNFREKISELPTDLQDSAKSAEFYAEAEKKLQEIRNGSEDFKNQQKWEQYRKKEAQKDSEFKARDTRFDFEKKDFEILRAEQEQWEAITDRLKDKMEEVENTFDEVDEKAVAELQNLSEAMDEAALHAKNLKDAADVAEWQNKIKELQKDYNEGLMSGVKNAANSLDRLTDGFKKIKESMEDEDTSAWEKIIMIINELVQLFDTLNSLSQTFNTLQLISQKLVKAKNDEEMLGLAQTVAAQGAVNVAKGTDIALTKTATAAEGKEAAAAVANTAAKSGEAIAGATASGAKLPFPWNIAAIAAGIAAVVGALAMIGKFASGGVVGGNSYHGDHVLARLNSGEMVLNNSQQGKLWNAINSGNLGGGKVGGKVQFEIRGDTLQGVLNNFNMKKRG